MSFINKICKLDKLFLSKASSTLNSSNSILRYSSNVNNNLYQSNKLLSLSNRNWSSEIYFRRQMQTLTHSYHAQEAMYARLNVIGASEKYSNTLASVLPEKENLQVSDVQDVLDKQWISMSTQEILENFEYLSYHAKKNNEAIADPKYQGVLEVMANKIPEFSDKEIKFLLKCLDLWHLDAKNATFQLFFKAIDKECIKRRNDWSIEEILLVNDLLFCIRLNRISDFTWKSLNKLASKPQNLTPANLVQLVFFLKVNREVRTALYNIEFHFEQNFDHFTLDELGIFAMAFEKYKTTIKSKDFLIKIMQKVIDQIDSVNDITLVALLKMFRFINTPDYFQQTEKLIKTLEDKIDEKSMNVAVFTASWLKFVRFENKELFSKLLNRFEKELPNMKLSFIEKIIYALFSFNCDPKETALFSQIFDEILKPERDEEIKKYAKSFIKINLSALNSNFYSEKALKLVMDPEFREPFFSSDHLLLQDFLILDFLIEIEHPEYDGPRLEKEKLTKLLKKLGGLCNYIRRKNKRIIAKGYILENVTSTCQKICGSESAVHEDMLLPHLALTDIVLCYDPETKKYLSPKEHLSQIPNGEIKYAPKDGKEWYSLVIASPLVFSHNTHAPTGLLALRLRNLKCIGYKPIVIPMTDLFSMKEEDQRHEYLSKLLP